MRNQITIFKKAQPHAKKILPKPFSPLENGCEKGTLDIRRKLN